MLAVVAQVAIADIVDGVAGAGDLAGKDPVGAVAMAFEVISDYSVRWWRRCQPWAVPGTFPQCRGS